VVGQVANQEATERRDRATERHVAARFLIAFSDINVNRRCFPVHRDERPAATNRVRRVAAALGSLLNLI
jgi:hypothetical protein